MLKKSLPVLEYVVFIAMLIVSCIIGIYFRFSGGKQKTVEEFLYGNRRVSLLPVAFSMMATTISGVGILGLTAEIYLFGLQVSAISFAYILALPYLGIRFGNATKMVASVTFVLQTTMFLAVVLYAPSLALSTMTNITKWTSIITIGLVCTFYCYLGGMKAVLWTDLFQSMMIYAGVIAIITTGLLKHKNLWNKLNSTGRSDLGNFSFDPTVRYSFWSVIIGGFFMALSSYAASQTLIQRMITVKTLKESRCAVILGIFLTVLQVIAISFCGVIIYVEFADCDPLTAKIITSADQILPYYVTNAMEAIPGISGICLAGLFSASISTMSSGINSQAAVTLEDFVAPFVSTPLDESKATMITKFLILLYGAVCIIFNFVIENFGGILKASATISGVLGGPLLGLFTLGMAFKASNQKGALSGFLISVFVCLWIGFGSMYSGLNTKPLPLLTEKCDNVTVSEILNFNSTENIMIIYRISYFWYAPIGCILVVFIGLIVSLLTGETCSVQGMFSTVFCWICKSRNRSQHREDVRLEEIVSLN